MKNRVFGSTGIHVPIVGQGTWQMEQDDRRSAIESIIRGIDAGMTHIDTAELYGDGQVEERIVREAISGHHRDKLFLVSKVKPENATAQGTVAACEASLARLRTDYLDCYLLHWPGAVPLGDTIGGFENLMRDGKIRYWGVSNFDELQLAEVLQLAGPGRVACNQVLYHLNERRIEHAVLPSCEKHNVALVAYSPFGSGRFPVYDGERGKLLRSIATAHKASPHQVALAFLTRKAPVFALPKASHVDHVLDNAHAGDLVLTKEEIAAIDTAFPRGTPKPGIPML